MQGGPAPVLKKCDSLKATTFLFLSDQWLTLLKIAVAQLLGIGAQSSDRNDSSNRKSLPGKNNEVSPCIHALIFGTEFVKKAYLFRFPALIPRRHNRILYPVPYSCPRTLLTPDEHQR